MSLPESAIVIPSTDVVANVNGLAGIDEMFENLRLVGQGADGYASWHPRGGTILELVAEDEVIAERYTAQYNQHVGDETIARGETYNITSVLLGIPRETGRLTLAATAPVVERAGQSRYVPRIDLTAQAGKYSLQSRDREE